MVRIPVVWVLWMGCAMSRGHVGIVTTLGMVMLGRIMVLLMVRRIVLLVRIVTGLGGWGGLCCCCEVVERAVVHFGLGRDHDGRVLVAVLRS